MNGPFGDNREGSLINIRVSRVLAAWRAIMAIAEFGTRVSVSSGQPIHHVNGIHVERFVAQIFWPAWNGKHRATELGKVISR